MIREHSKTHLWVISADPQEGLSGGVPPSKLMQLALSVKGGQVEPLGSSKPDVTGALAGIGKDDAVW